ncbi:MAG: TAXI family TRAP transporter solute-binding subunit [Smithellaceae bacterium]
MAILIVSAAIVIAALYVAYRLIDPLPPNHFAIAAGIPGTTYDDLARQYSRILARDGVNLEVRNYASAMEHFDALRNVASGVQAAFTQYRFTQTSDATTLYSLGGISDTAIFIFYRGAEPITRFVQFRGKHLSIGMPKTALRTLMLEVLNVTGALDDSISLSDLNYDEAIDALVAGKIDVVMIPAQVKEEIVQRAFAAPGIHLMNVSQAEAIAKSVAGLKHVVLWRGLVSLTSDIPNSNVDLLALRNRLLVRKDLHPALQYLLLKAMREVHGVPGPFNRLGEFPSEQPNDLPLSPTAQTFYRSGLPFWQQYTSFWLTSLLSRIVFFVIPVLAMMIPIIGFAPRVYRWLHIRPLDRLHRALGNVERDLNLNPDSSRLVEYQRRVVEIDSAVQSLKIRRPFEADMHRLTIHLRMVREDINRLRESDSSMIN